MKKLWIALFAAMLAPSMALANSDNAAKINLIKKLYKTDAQGFYIGSPYSNYASPSFKKTIKQAYKIIDKTGDYCDVSENYDQGLGNGDSKISKLKITPLSGNIVKVSFSDYSQKVNLKYDISCTNGRCVINDIIQDGRSVKKQYQRIISSKSCG